MSRGYTTSQDRSRRRMATVIIVVGVVIVVGWIAAVAALAGQSPSGGGKGSQQGGEEGAASGSSGQQAASQETTADEANALATAKPTQPDSGGQDEAPAGGQPPVVEGANTEQAIAGETRTPDVFDPLEGEGEQGGSASAADSEGDSGKLGGSTVSEQAGPGLSETDRTRARAASERYIVAAYGYSGGSSEEYLAGIEQEAASEEIYDSPGGSMLKGYSQAAPECGMKSTAILEGFEVIGQSPEGLDVDVTFTVEDADGETHTFRQQQRLTSSEGGYAVSGVSVEELISETTPEESCPGGKSEDAASEGEGETEVKPDKIGVAEEDRAKAAADRYITAAYGYTGDSGEEYRKRVERTVDEETFYSSPGGQQVKSYAEAAEENGITAAAVMDRFEISSTGGRKIEGTAYFRVGKSYDRYAEIEGESTPFAIDLTLTPVRSTYEVSRALVEREVSERRISGAGAKKTS